MSRWEGLPGDRSITVDGVQYFRADDVLKVIDKLRSTPPTAERQQTGPVEDTTDPLVLERVARDAGFLNFADAMARLIAENRRAQEGPWFAWYLPGMEHNVYFKHKGDREPPKDAVILRRSK